MKTPKQANHYYYSTASKICAGEQSRGWGFTPIEHDKNSDRYKDILSLIEEAMKTAPDPIYIPQRAASLYFQQAKPKKLVLVAIHNCGKCGVYIGATAEDDLENYPCPICDAQNVNKITFELKL